MIEPRRRTIATERRIGCAGSSRARAAVARGRARGGQRKLQLRMCHARARRSAAGAATSDENLTKDLDFGRSSIRMRPEAGCSAPCARSIKPHRWADSIHLRA